jgi:hypothetical protein
MKKRIEFAVTPDKYTMRQTDPENAALFVIDKSSLSFSTKEFYETFFKGLPEKPAVEVYCDDEENLDEGAKVIFNELKELVNSICEGIQEEWFAKKQSDPPVGGEQHSLEELSS